MNTSIFVLIGILFILMAGIGGSRGIRSFFSIVYTVTIFMLLLIFISMGFDPIKTALIGSLFISIILLFNINGVNKMTVVSSLSVLITILLTLLISLPFVQAAKIQGFSYEQVEQLSAMTPYIDINLADIVFIEILIGLLGAVIDVAISISSAMNELYVLDPSLSFEKLFASGMKIGRDILGTMTHTLLFAFLGGFFSILIWFSTLDYSFANTINSKLFVGEIFHIVCGGIGILMVIPITAVLMATVFTRNN
ncbi:YibE/F family protein [Fusibacter bizertensis]